MNVNDIITAISTVGFPIACCCFLLWQNSKQDNYNREQMEKLRATIDNNTKSIDALHGVVQELAAMIKGMKKGD